MANENFLLHRAITGGLQAIQADTNDLTSDITCLTNIIYALAEAGNLTPEQFKVAMKSALSEELEASKDDCAILTEGDNTRNFVEEPVHYVELQLDDPSVFDRHGSAKRKKTVYVGLNRRYDDIINDRTRNPRVITESDINSVFFTRIDHYEAANGKQPFLQYNCIRCGNGLSVNGCKGCDHQFEDDKFRTGGSPALSQDAMALIKKELPNTFDLENKALKNAN
jgi:hypothetical protein